LKESFPETVGIKREEIKKKIIIPLCYPKNEWLDSQQENQIFFITTQTKSGIAVSLRFSIAQDIRD
jgi:hypothetical protein